jgi:hypothetical protein
VVRTSANLDHNDRSRQISDRCRQSHPALRREGGVSRLNWHLMMDEEVLSGGLWRDLWGDLWEAHKIPISEGTLANIKALEDLVGQMNQLVTAADRVRVMTAEGHPRLFQTRTHLPCQI